MEIDLHTPMPIGKHKGKPIVEVLADTSYVQWFTSQAFAEEKYPAIFNFFMGGGGAPTETPEHNGLQARFLDDAVWKRIAANPPAILKRAILANLRQQAKYGLKETTEHLRDMEARLADRARMLEVALDDVKKHGASNWSTKNLEERKVKLAEAQDGLVTARESYTNAVAKKSMADAEDIYEKLTQVFVPNTRFEHEGWDVAARLTLSAPETNIEVSTNVYVEIKPSLGDDYPAVLRQMQVNQRRVWREEFNSPRGLLYTKAITARGATPEQVLGIFKASGFDIFVDSHL